MSANFNFDDEDGDASNDDFDAFKSTFDDQEEEDDDDDQLDLDQFDDTGLLALASRERAKAEANEADTASTKNATASLSVAAMPAVAVRSTESTSDGVEDDDEYGGNNFGFGGDGDDRGDWSDVDWEDANESDSNEIDGGKNEQDMEEGENQSVLQKEEEIPIPPIRKFPTQGITINFGSAEKNEDNDENVGDKKPAAKKKRRPNRVLRDVPYETQQLLINVRRSHMLCCVGHSIRCSYVCGGGKGENRTDKCEENQTGDFFERELLSHVVHSLIPLEFHSDSNELQSCAKMLVPSSSKFQSTSATASFKGKRGKLTIEANQPLKHGKSSNISNDHIPTKNQLREFSQWFFQFVNHVGERRREAIRRNVALGAAVHQGQTGGRARGRGRRSQSQNQRNQRRQRNRRSGNFNGEKLASEPKSPMTPLLESESKPPGKRRRRTSGDGNTIIDDTQKNMPEVASPLEPTRRQSNEFEESFAFDLVQKAMCLSPHYDEDPQLLLESDVFCGTRISGKGGTDDGMDAIQAVERISGHDKVLLFLAMVRSLGWRARYVTALDPLPLELTVDHPILSLSSSLNNSKKSKSSKSLNSSFKRNNHTFLDPKPSAAEREKYAKLLHDMFRLMGEGGVLDVKPGGKQSSNRKNKGNATAETTIDLLSSSDEEDGTNAMNSNPAKANNKNGKAYVAAAKSKKRKMTQAMPNKHNAPHQVGSNAQTLSWIEVLCRNDDTNDRNVKSDKVNKKPNSSEPRATEPVARWVSIIPEHESFDRTEDIETLASLIGTHESTASQLASGGKSRRSWKPSSSPNKRQGNKSAKIQYVSYVVAVEHVLSPVESGVDSKQASSKQDKPNSGNYLMEGVRLADVTPRYASVWSQTLRLRGTMGRDIAKSGGKCADGWWASCLKQINRHCKLKTRPAIGKYGKGAHQQKSPTKVQSPTPAVKKSVVASDGKNVEVFEIGSSDDEKVAAILTSSQTSDSDSDSDGQINHEAEELKESISKESIPTSKAAFKQHPLYVIPSVLHSHDVLHPDAKKRIRGVFKGELVYLRSDVSKALRAKKWLYNGRKVMDCELSKPAKQVKARKKPQPKGFKALSSYGVSETAQEDLLESSSSMQLNNHDSDEMENLYGIWQTDLWSPSYVGPADPIPTNDHNNVELALMNPGLSHVDLPRLASIARKLGVPYAPCLIGYEGHGGNRTPTIRGIVVHDHNVALLQEAHAEWESHAAELERQERKNEILRKWKRLVVGILTKDRLDREYG